jgi:hypothetical protein
MMSSLRESERADRPLPGRLWSLWDMYNLCLRELHEALTNIAHAHAFTEPLVRAGQPNPPLEALAQILSQLESFELLCKRLNMANSVNRLPWILRRLRDGTMTTAFLRDDTRSLHESVIDDARQMRLYAYPNERADRLDGINAEWEIAFTSFPSAKPEIVAAVDLYCLNHHTAAVFHFMRAVEVALRALARERKVKLKKDKPIESAQWQDLITAISGAIKEIGLNWKAGRKKEIALEFYSGALGHMTALKDKYRNQVSHSTRTYDEHETASAMLHVRELMNALGKRLNENLKRSIAWGG